MLTKTLRANPPASASTSKMLPWKEVDEDDLRKFMGLIMLMGFTERHGSLQLYWTTDSLLTIPIFHQVKLLAVMRFCDFILTLVLFEYLDVGCFGACLL